MKILLIIPCFFPDFKSGKISLLLPFSLLGAEIQDAEDEAAGEDKAEESGRDLVKTDKAVVDIGGGNSCVNGQGTHNVAPRILDGDIGCLLYTSDAADD